MQEDTTSPSVGANDTVPAGAPTPLASTFSPAKILGAVLSAAFSDCDCESCEVLRGLGRELADALTASTPSKDAAP